MDAQYLQNLRYKLQKRVRRLSCTIHPLFHYGLKQFWGFLMDYPIFMGILDDLALREPGAEADAQRIIKEGERLVFGSELQNSAVAYFVVKQCAATEDPDTEWRIGSTYLRGRELSEDLDQFCALFVETLYEYIDEHLDDQSMVLALLRRYKHKCEWFQREKLFKRWEDDTQRGEKHIASHRHIAPRTCLDNCLKDAILPVKPLLQ